MVEIRKWVVAVFLAVLITGLIACLYMALKNQSINNNDRDTKGYFCMDEQSRQTQ